MIEEMTLNNYKCSNEDGQPKSIRGKFDVDAFTLLTVKID